MLISNTPSGWDSLRAHFAAALDAAFVSDAFDVKPGPVFVRRVFNGKLDAEVALTGGKVVVTVQPGAVSASRGQTSPARPRSLAVDLLRPPRQVRRD